MYLFWDMFGTDVDSAQQEIEEYSYSVDRNVDSPQQEIEEYSYSSAIMTRTSNNLFRISTPDLKINLH